MIFITYVYDRNERNVPKTAKPTPTPIAIAVADDTEDDEVSDTGGGGDVTGSGDGSSGSGDGSSGSGEGSSSCGDGTGEEGGDRNSESSLFSCGPVKPQSFPLIVSGTVSSLP